MGEVSLIIDGREVTANEGEMLHDAARQGDVEIPVFCYEPKLGEPVGACRMCLVEIEGIPKLQTSCSTPVRDGMVVHTRTDQVKHAQSAVVEFLLVNHPLDCPVCDKGGECPLQDISMGWGPGKSRVVDPKRHFEKPVELSPLIAIDRERCILCYRCVRFSQEVAEDSQLQLLERGDRTFVGTFDDRPYIAPFHGNITDLCPVGALTSYTYRFRARPWDIEQAGSVCTLCPSQCNVSFTVRDEQVKRVIARDNPDVDDGWLCDRGRYGFEMFGAEERVTAPRGKSGELGWPDAIAGAGAALRAGGARTAAIVGDASNEEAFLVQRILRDGLGSPHVDSRVSRGAGRGAQVRLAQPELSARVRDIDSADVVLLVGADPLHASPIIDLRIRKAMRRNGTRLALATERPTTLDGGADAIARYAPGEGAHFLSELSAALGGGENVATPLADALRESGVGGEEPKKVVLVWGERVLRDAGGAAALLGLADALGVAAAEGAGLLEIPELANARGLRESGCLPDAGPGLTAAAGSGKATEEIRTALIDGELDTLVLFGANPLRDFPDTPEWKSALAAATVISFSTFEDETTAAADFVFPLETHAEKDGTVTHPDGRLQRVRPSAGRPGNIRPNWGVLAELALAIGLDTGISSQPTAFAALTEAAPIYSGLTDAEIGGRGIRWYDRPAASMRPTPEETSGAGSPDTQRGAPTGSTEYTPSAREVASGESAPGGSFRLGTYRDLWTGAITELNPPLRFLAPKQRVEMSLADAERLGVKIGDLVKVSADGATVEAAVDVKERAQDGTVFLIEGVRGGNANALLNGGPVNVAVEKVETAS
jgi:NADH-quinone oxidoreductase subunit G